MKPRSRFLSGLVVSLGILPLPGLAIEPDREQALGELLQHDCGSCHGTRLLGGLGPPLTPERMNHLPESLIVDAILDGRAGTAMPPWRALLSREDATWLARRLKHEDSQ